MLKKRIIPLLTFIDNKLVKSINFNKLINVGDPIKAAKIYNDSDADEIVLLNISRNNRDVKETSKLLDKLAKNCFMPISVGGGIKNYEDVQMLFNAGADKIIFNSLSYANTSLIRRISEDFGNQSIVISLDVRLKNKNFSLYSNCGNKFENVTLKQHISNIGEEFIGEILINSIDRDGSMIGFDEALLKNIVSITSKPIIACGGAGNLDHLKKAFLQYKISAVACGSIFNFGDYNPIRIKKFLINYNLDFKMIDQ